MPALQYDPHDDDDDTQTGLCYMQKQKKFANSELVQPFLSHQQIILGVFTWPRLVVLFITAVLYVSRLGPDERSTNARDHERGLSAW